MKLFPAIAALALAAAPAQANLRQQFDNEGLADRNKQSLCRELNANATFLNGNATYGHKYTIANGYVHITYISSGSGRCVSEGSRRFNTPTTTRGDFCRTYTYEIVVEGNELVSYSKCDGSSVLRDVWAYRF